MRLQDRAPLAICTLSLISACYSPNEPGESQADSSQGTTDPTSGGASSLPTSTFTSMSTQGESETGVPTTQGSSTDSEDSDTSTSTPAVCGDAVVHEDEACDDGMNDGSYGGCEPGCTALAPHCGDEVQQRQEDCDDGNQQNADGCNNDCIESASELWTRTLTGASPGAVGYGVAVGPTNEVVAVGGTSTEAFVWKLDAEGTDVWTEHHSGGGQISANAVAIDGAGTVLVGGAIGGVAWVRRYDDAGVMLWDDEYGVNERVVSGIAIDEEGNALLVGARNVGAGTGYDVWVRRIDPDGAEIWTATFHGGLADYGTGAAIDGNGRFLAAGYENAAGTNTWLRRYDVNGAEDWTRSYNGGGNDFAFAVATGPDDAVVIAGRSQLAGSDAVWARLYDARGTEQWTETFESGFASSTDVAYGVAMDGAGNVIVVGEVQAPDPDISRAWVRKLDAGGVEAWTREWSVGNVEVEAETAARGVATDSADNVIVVGYEVRDDELYEAWIRKLAP